MHRFLRSIGFSTYQKRRDIFGLLESLAEGESKKRRIVSEEDFSLCEIRAEIAPGMGIAMIGEIDDSGKFHRDSYYPYVNGNDISSTAECTIQRHTDKESYAGLLDENRVGISLIFFMNNSFDYMERIAHRAVKQPESVKLTGLSVEGKILLPIQRNQKQTDQSKLSAADRNSLMEAAKNGDQNAIETLTIEDIDMYSQISRRIMKEDVYSIVDSSFMPSGVECDQYSIIGTIFHVEEIQNRLTGEMVYDLTVDCNDMIFHVIIAKQDLFGEPKVGRRFKGAIWMQGIVEFAGEGIMDGKMPEPGAAI